MANSEKKHINLAGVTAVGSGKKVQQSRKSRIDVVKLSKSGHGRTVSAKKDARAGEKRPQRRR